MSLLIPEIVFILKSALSEINIAILAFFGLVFAFLVLLTRPLRGSGRRRGRISFKTLNSQGVCTEKHPVQDGSLERESQGTPALSRSMATCRPVSAARLLRERQTGEVGDHGFGGFSNLEASSYHPSFPTLFTFQSTGHPRNSPLKLTLVCVLQERERD